ncbi:MAG TPA: serine--tRNA ligase, partial [Candidatus Hodarchaeales archaeon]|nr:serine--tRNA ligase [Candidatus Hodarchaeales archaeon]
MIPWIDDLLKTDKEWRDLKGKADTLRHRRNTISLEINKLKKEGKEASKVMSEAAEIPKKIEQTEKKIGELQQKNKDRLLRIPNLLHTSVPIGKDETENQLVRLIGKKPKHTFTLKSHVDILKELDLAELERATKIAGARWYFLKGDLAILEMALARYGIDFMRKKGYELVVPPYMMNRAAYEGVTSLADFEEVLYKIDGEDLYLIATSEHPLTAQFMNEILPEEQLPINLVGYSTNFRKEAGAHGKDTKGIFRVHQFNKVEQIILCKPEESWHMHEELLKNIEEFFASLGLHCRTVNICTGDIGTVAAKKYDVEVWMPVQNTYREVGSCSNCTNYQAVRLHIRSQK